MIRTRMIGWTAMAACGLGYSGMAAILIAAKADMIAPTMAIVFAAISALVGEAGLWVGAACLGLTIFNKRKALIDRLLARRRTGLPQV